MSKKKGFTLVELLVVIAIIALLMGILMPALARVRQIAYRLYCGTNLSGIGKAMLIYAQDFDDEMPQAGGPGGTWVNTIANWRAVDRAGAYGASGDASITSCFYLLIKYAEVGPKSFLCKGDSGATEFNPGDYGAGGIDLIDLWDFGPDPQDHCSYSYHKPWGSYGLTTASEPGMAVAADPNPWQETGDGSGRDPGDFGAFDPDGSTEFSKLGNAITHQDDGQNVLFMDGHTSFEKKANCGIDEDNIYTVWTTAGEKRRGTRGDAATLVLKKNDSYLITDGPPVSAGGGGR